MMIKTDLLGACLNLQLLCAFLGAVLPRTVGKWIWYSVLPISIAALTIRGIEVGHAPLRNLFEAFMWVPLCLAACTLWTSWRHKISTVHMDAVLGFIIGFPLAFVFSAQVSPLPPALQSPFFVPHVFGYMLAYSLLARALFFEIFKQTLLSRKNVASGFFLITLSLALGSMWGNEAWGAYWQWDPKEQWSLATWLIYATYFHAPNKRWLRILWLSLGLLVILLTVTWINLSKLFPGLHSYAGL